MTRPEVGLIIYDLDGTLVDSVPDIAVALNISLAASGLPPVDEGTVRDWVGNGARKLVERALRHSGQPADAASIDSVYRQFLEDYSRHLCEKTVIYPGVAECLQRCRVAGWVQAVVTNKPEALAKGLLQALELDRYFAAVLGGDSLPEKKPHPAPLETVMRGQGADRSRALMVGDSETDLEAARAAGIDSIAVSYGYNRGLDLRSSGALTVLDTLSELPEYLARST